jgi:hypothetical protein
VLALPCNPLWLDDVGKSPTSGRAVMYRWVGVEDGCVACTWGGQVELISPACDIAGLTDGHGAGSPASAVRLSTHAVADGERTGRPSDDHTHALDGDVDYGS